jgi:Thioredoxin reductase
MYELIIIGAGPAGISMGAEAVSFGISPEKVLIIEKAREHSFTIKKFYPEKKLVTANYKGVEPVCKGVLCMIDSSKVETISYLDKAIEDNKLHINYNETVFKIDRDKKAKTFTIVTSKNTYTAKIVVVAVGILGKPNAPDYPIPASVKERVLYDITTREIKNAKVLIVGGGDSASEYCQFLSAEEENNEVYLSYRRDEFGRMNTINRESLLKLARDGKVKLLLGTNIQSVSQSNTRIAANFIEDELESIEFDYIIYALGGTSPTNFLKTIGIEFHGPKPALKSGYETNVPGMFLIGDLSAGAKGGSIIGAFNSANEAMNEICNRYFQSNVQ